MYIYLLIKDNKIDNEGIEDDLNSELSWNILVIIISIMVLLLGSHLVVDNAIKIANFFKINTLTIGVTIIALGTSLPELFTGVIAIKKKQYNLLIGNIVGSNILNIVFVLGFSSIIMDIQPMIESNKLLYISIALITSHLILILAYLYNRSVSKFTGFILLLIYLIFLYKIF
jgi:cation:H+ antiporter